MIPLLAKSVALPVVEASQVGEVRRTAVVLAEGLGFGPTEVGAVGIVATEAATNLVKHARDGLIVLRGVKDTAPAAVEVLALDRGPGMADVAQCLRDGYSTAGGPGTGLGAIRRLAMTFDLFSLPDVGTALLAQIAARPLATGQPESSLEVGVVCVPIAGEQICGDAWAVSYQRGRSVFLVADGLGHGALAATAADEAVRLFEANAQRSPAEFIQLAHAALRSTRGAAMAVAEVNVLERLVRFAGVGNIAARILHNGASQGLVSHNGTVGHQLHTVREFTYPWPEGALLVLNSDGLLTQWSLDRYPGLAEHHPALVASIVLRDFSRNRDDVTVVVARERAR